MATQEEIKNASLKINKEFFSLEPSSIINLFEIDLTDLGFDTDNQFIINLREIQITLPGTTETINNNFNYRIIRLHNNLKLGKNVIYWNDKPYLPAPIVAEGFELASKGVFPKPKISISLSNEMLDVFSLFKGTVNFGDLIGAKFTRRRTFAKFLDRKNFYQTDSNAPLTSDYSSIPEGFDPDPNCEFPKDVYFLDRKSFENKNSIQFELSSSIDLDRVKLPRRRVLSYACPWQYRGEGCLYEYQSRLNEQTHGTTTPIPNQSDSTGAVAPACATEDNQLIKDIISSDQFAKNDPVEWKPQQSYQKGAVVFISKKNINFYFVARSNVPVNVPPPNANYWLADQCSKTLKGCRIRFGQNPLPFGGFYGVSNYQRGSM